jgi:hypothetical protein
MCRNSLEFKDGTCFTYLPYMFFFSVAMHRHLASEQIIAKVEEQLRHFRAVAAGILI